MTAFILILAFPLIAGLCYGLFYFIGNVVTGGKRPEVLDRYNMVVYAVLLLIPLIVVLLALRPAATGMAAGIAWPSLFGLSTALAVPLSVLVGVAIGVLLYYGEVFARMPRRPATGYKTDVQYLADGHTEEVVRHAQQLPVVLLLGVTVFVACVEEVLWRGYLIGYAMNGLSLSWGLALLISAAAFGINHYYFGLWNVASKVVLGGVWGGLFLLTESLLIPIASHLTFNVMALHLTVEMERQT